MPKKAIDDVEEILAIIGDTEENRKKLEAILSELVSFGKSVQAGHKAEEEEPEEEEKQATAEEEAEEEEEEEEEEAEEEKKQAETEAEEEEEEEAEEEKKAQIGGLVGVIDEKLRALREMVEGDAKKAVDEIIKLVESLGRARYPYPEPSKYPYPYPYPYPQATKELEDGLASLTQRISDLEAKLAEFGKVAEKVEQFESAITEEKEVTNQLKSFLSMLPKSAIRPSREPGSKVADDDETVKALEKEGGRERQLLPGFIGFRVQS